MANSDQNINNTTPINEEDTEMNEIDDFLNDDSRPQQQNNENAGMAQMDLPPTPSSSTNSSRANTPTQGESLADPGSETTSAVRRRVGKVYPPKPAAGKRDLLMAIDFHQISVQVTFCLSFYHDEQFVSKSPKLSDQRDHRKSLKVESI